MTSLPVQVQDQVGVQHCLDTETCVWAGRYMIRPLRSSYGYSRNEIF